MYYWYKDGELLTMTKNPELVIVDAQPDDRGSYMCLAVNEAGNVTSTPGLVVIPGERPCQVATPHNLECYHYKKLPLQFQV